MIFESVVLSALFYGLISAATLPLGASIGVVWRPPDRVMAFLLAFGGGALLAALTIDLIAPGVDRGHFEHLAIGAMLGGLLFKLLDFLVNRKGGYLRKPSTAMTYWRNRARDRLEAVLSSVRRTQPLGNLSTAVEDKLLSILLVQDVPADTCLYRADDPATNLYRCRRGARRRVSRRGSGRSVCVDRRHRRRGNADNGGRNHAAGGFSQGWRHRRYFDPRRVSGGGLFQYIELGDFCQIPIVRNPDQGMVE